jgi:trigger factor
LKSFIKRSEGLVREIEVEIPAETVDAAFAEYYHKYRKDANIPGFRPGKAPLAIIKSKYDKEIQEDVLEQLIRGSYTQAIRDNNIDLAAPPTFPSFELKEGAPLKYIIRLEVMPRIESVNYEGLKLPIDNIQAHDSEVDAVVEDLRQKAADIRTVNRPALATDIVKMDIKKLEDPDKILLQDEFPGAEIDLSSPITVKEFREEMVNSKPGDEKDIVINYPADYAVRRFAGKMVKHHCRILEIKEKILPEVNDDFARRVGNLATVDELRLKIREDIKRQKQIEHEKWKKNEIRHQVIDKNQIEVPEGMIENYLDNFMEDFKKHYRDFDKEKIRTYYRPLAIEAIRWHLLSARLAELEKIEVLPEDTEKWIEEFAERYRMEIDKAKAALSESGRIEEIKDSILEDKIFDFLISKATYVPAEQFQPPDEKENI